MRAERCAGLGPATHPAARAAGGLTQRCAGTGPVESTPRFVSATGVTFFAERHWANGCAHLRGPSAGQLLQSVINRCRFRVNSLRSSAGAMAVPGRALLLLLGECARAFRRALRLRRRRPTSRAPNRRRQLPHRNRTPDSAPPPARRRHPSMLVADASSCQGAARACHSGNFGHAHRAPSPQHTATRTSARS